MNNKFVIYLAPVVVIGMFWFLFATMSNWWLGLLASLFINGLVYLYQKKLFPAKVKDETSEM